MKLSTPKMYFKRFDNMENYKPILEDGTAKLLEVQNIEVEVDLEDNEEIFICFFANLSWYPMGKGVVKDGRVIFKDVGGDRILYMGAQKMGKKLIGVLMRRR